MPKKEYTHITIILDRTGSMEAIRDDTIGGFNAFLKSQKELGGFATLTLVQFDSQDPYEALHQFRPVAQVPELTRQTFVPRASTPLLDALGRGINDLEKSLSDLADEERPDKIIFVVITDGQENASREFRRDQILKMVQEKTEKARWQFVFLSADLDAVDEAMHIGFTAAQSLAFDRSQHGNAAAWHSISNRITAYRNNASDQVAFDDEDRAQQENERKRNT